jgi:hypothetical protein
MLIHNFIMEKGYKLIIMLFNKHLKKLKECLVVKE